ncbi:MAG: hypothetical protein IJ225_12590 [Solobacterium sp.]|nr:hypothetical protein [Solobacterium sp.]
MGLEEEKTQRIERANRSIQTINEFLSKVHHPLLRKRFEELGMALRDLRDTQYLFDSGEKELIRLYDRYLPYFLTILDNYISLQESGNYEAISSNTERLITTVSEMVSAIRAVIRILPQDEIDEANARAKAEELRAMLEEQRNNVLK